MTALALEAAFAHCHLGRVNFRRVAQRVDERVGDADVQRLSLASAGHLYPREGAADRQQASEGTAARSLRVRPGNLVINPMWLVGGSVAVSALAGAVSPDYRVFSLAESVHPRYLHHLLRSEPYRRQYDLFVRADTTFDRRIQQGDIDDMPLWLPPAEEQRRTADFLDERVARIDQIIAARRAQGDNLRQAGRGQLVECVFQAEDQVTRCSRIAEVQLGRQRSPETERGDNILPYIRSANVMDGMIDVDDVKQMNFTPSEQPRFALLYGDVLVTEAAGSVDSIGAACAWRGQLTGTVGYQNHLLRLRARDGVSPHFLEMWARASHASGAAKAFATGASILNLGTEAMKRMPFPQIDVQEQTRRAERAQHTLDSHDQAAATVLQQAGLLQEYKQSLITAAVTGELDVTTASTRIPGE